MKLINEITNSAKQHHTLVLDSGETIDLKLYFMPRVSAWFFNVEYGEINVCGCQLVLGLLLLRQFKNQLPFDFLVSSSDGVDPYRLDDFTTERVKFYLLNSDDITQIEANVYDR